MLEKRVLLRNDPTSHMPCHIEIKPLKCKNNMVLIMHSNAKHAMSEIVFLIYVFLNKRAFTFSQTIYVKDSYVIMFAAFNDSIILIF